MAEAFCPSCTSADQVSLDEAANASSGNLPLLKGAKFKMKPELHEQTQRPSKARLFRHLHQVSHPQRYQRNNQCQSWRALLWRQVLPGGHWLPNSQWERLKSRPKAPHDGMVLQSEGGGRHSAHGCYNRDKSSRIRKKTSFPAMAICPLEYYIFPPTSMAELNPGLFKLFCLTIPFHTDHIAISTQYCWHWPKSHSQKCLEGMWEWPSSSSRRNTKPRSTSERDGIDATAVTLSEAWAFHSKGEEVWLAIETPWWW